MSAREVPGALRRELRYSRAAIETNLNALGLSMAEVKPLTEALFDEKGLLGLYGSELLLLERLLGIGSGSPATKLVGELISVKRAPAGTGVSYGYLTKLASDTNLGLVALGFSDGLPRAATNQFSVSIAGVGFKGVGRIAMDQCVIDLGSSSPDVGAEVTFFNDNFSLNDFSKASGFSELEILGRMHSRVARVWAE
jgi:alanine racemase